MIKLKEKEVTAKQWIREISTFFFFFFSLIVIQNASSGTEINMGTILQEGDT